ncbi:MAG: FAD-dependent oxidoreductase [Phycisphaerae bacterium]|nr:FAD-dependent oxidoreductase [Phycisphaerae bacterium]
MLDRRHFLGAGFAALALGLVGSRRASCDAGGRIAPPSGGRPILGLNGLMSGPTTLIGGYRFSSRFDGDWPEDVSHPPLDASAQPQSIEEHSEVVVVGGGLSGLACAYHLREHRPIVLERLGRFGGASQGERWRGTEYSLGGAYFIEPDKGSSLESLYRELGLDRIVRIDAGASPAELNGAFIDDFWTWAGVPDEDRPAFEAYRELVAYYVEHYPEIPLVDGEDNEWILELDRVSLKEHVETALGGAAPALLASAIQSYCYSSFGAGWEEISAASGWNFIAAEEYGRWVLPGGNSTLAERLWERLSREPGVSLRSSCNVVDIRLDGGDGVVTYDTGAGVRRTIRASKVIVSCPKYVAKFIVRDLNNLDAEKLDAMQRIEYRPYVVANVLLSVRLERDFYDLFLLGDGVYPTNAEDAEKFSRPTDVVTGHFAQPGNRNQSVLTLYWPLPWDTARFTLTPNVSPLETYAARLAPRLDAILALLELPKRAVEQVRLVRWGHAMPVARPGFIADGLAERVRRSIGETIYFVEQDNWALPAVETCLLEAQSFSAEIEAGLTVRK